MELLNIEIDKNSKYSFESLDENVFLTKFFSELQQIMGNDFFKYTFYLYGNMNSSELPYSCGKKSLKKKVLIFLSNEDYNELNASLPGDFFAIFKCYSTSDEIRGRIFSFPLGYVKTTRHLEVKDILQRKIRVFFSGNLHPNRIPFYRALSGSKIWERIAMLYLKNLKRRILRVPDIIKRNFSYKFPASYLVFTNGYKKGLSGEEYSKKLYDSQIALCPKGTFVTETFRLFEAMRAGCVIISKKFPDTYLYRNSPIIQVNNWQEGIEKVKMLLQNPNLLSQYHKATLDWWENVCNETSTAKYVNNKLKSLESITDHILVFKKFKLYGIINIYSYLSKIKIILAQLFDFKLQQLNSNDFLIIDSNSLN